MREAWEIHFRIFGDSSLLPTPRTDAVEKEMPDEKPKRRDMRAWEVVRELEKELVALRRIGDGAAAIAELKEASRKLKEQAA